MQTPPNANPSFEEKGPVGLTWKVLGDISAHAKAEVLLAQLKLLQPLVSAEDTYAQTVCLETPESTPLLTIEVLGDWGWQRLIALMEALGLTDRLKHELFHRDPFDAAFR